MLFAPTLEMIETKELSKQYGRVQALDRLSVSIAAGEILGFLGPNGAGKSTALKILSGYLPPSSGTAAVNGLSLLSNSLEARSLVGYLPENFVAPSELFVAEYLTYRAGLKGVKPAERKAEVLRVMKLVGLEHRAHQRFDALSKGYKQRLGVADSLLGDPPILILDEPFSGLDPLQRQEFRQILRRLREANKAIVFSSHVLPEVEDLANRVLIIHHGKTRVTSDVKELLDSHDEVQIVAEGEHDLNLEAIQNCKLCKDAQAVADNTFTIKVALSQRAECLHQLAEARVCVTSFAPTRRDLESVFAEFVNSVPGDNI
jgi:ABC-2 type transport system ATP-binding protein